MSQGKRGHGSENTKNPHGTRFSWGFFMPIDPLPGLDDRMNHLRKIAIELHAAMRSMPQEQRETLNALGFTSKQRKWLKGQCYSFVGTLHKAARLVEATRK